MALMAVLCLASCDNSLSAPVVPTDEEAQRIERAASVIMNFVQKHSGQSHASNIPKDYFFIDLIID